MIFVFSMLQINFYLYFRFPGQGGSGQPSQGGTEGGNFQDDGDDDLYS